MFSSIKRLIILAALLCSFVSLQAQKVTFWDKVNGFLTKRAIVDTTRIYQPRNGFSLGVFSAGQKAGFTANVKFSYREEEEKPRTGISTYKLSENLCKKVGLEVGYGNVGLGYGLEVGPRSAMKKSSFALNILGKSWGLHLNYFKITNPFTSGLRIWDENNVILVEDEFTPDGTASLQNITIDGYYVFNNKRFAYPAAYKKSLVQRRTTGSWMLTARYMQGSLYNSPEGSWNSYNLIDCFNTLQASIGGGYSVNFVPWHKDPTGPREAGLRNLTINLTAMPVLTISNYLKTTTYQYEHNDETALAQHTDEKVSKIWCYPMPNYIGSAAVSLTLGRVYLSTQFTYNHLYFYSNVAFNGNHIDIPDYVDDFSFRGSFHDWTMKGLVVYSF